MNLPDGEDKRNADKVGDSFTRRKSVLTRLPPRMRVCMHIRGKGAKLRYNIIRRLNNLERKKS